MDVNQDPRGRCGGAGTDSEVVRMEGTAVQPKDVPVPEETDGDKDRIDPTWPCDDVLTAAGCSETEIEQPQRACHGVEDGTRKWMGSEDYLPLADKTENRVPSATILCLSRHEARALAVQQHSQHTSRSSSCKV
jgi:hypothetical protein